MTAAVHGRLITSLFARGELHRLPGAEPMPAVARRALEAWWHRCEKLLGPASSIRAITDAAVVPLARILALDVSERVDSRDQSILSARAHRTPVPIVVASWNDTLTHQWRAAVLSAISRDARWCLCCNGRRLRVIDARSTWSRDYLEFDLALLAEDSDAQNMLWSLLRRDALASQPPLLDRAVELSRRHGTEVCRALGAGVLTALRLLVSSISSRGRHSPDVVFEQSLTVLYRVLFLLFAEARGALPLWHPVYRDRYSIETLVTSILRNGSCRGLWEAIRAISRLAHTGCIAGELKVTAFNGRLFAPAHAAAFDSTRVPDRTIRDAVMAVSTTDRPSRSGVRRIAYRDLDVEQLGAVYEQVLEYEAVRDGDTLALSRTSDARKATASFYTPRAVTAYLVRRTLEPLVRNQPADAILSLRILDPAMGSGAFLVAACRYLAAAVEQALMTEGRWHPSDITPHDRAQVRREVASRCLYGVDLNPMAVQLARLSMWLATLAHDKPLSFLDHHLVSGDSLIGGSPGDVSRRRGRSRTERLPLFDGDETERSMREAVGVRLQIEADPDDSAVVVRAKERLLAALLARDSSLTRWSRVLDLWCALWFWSGGEAPDQRTFVELAGRLLRQESLLPEHVAGPLLDRAARIAAERRFVHWPLVFPEVFIDNGGAPRQRPGFDAVIGNPPWDMVRGDSGDAHVRTDRRAEARGVTSFARSSGVYRVESGGHLNRYQLFLERALQLARSDGRIGFILPSGVTGDAGTAALRRHLFASAAIDDVTGVDNRGGIFPIHRGLRFVILTARTGRPTTEVRCRFGVTRAEDLDRDDVAPIALPRAFLARVSGEDDLGIPELASSRDLRVVERITARCPRLGEKHGWHVHFGRELNATDDRGAFEPYTGSPGVRPVVEGRGIDPFRVHLDRCRWQLRPDSPASTAVRRRPRLCYRDVASATNRLTLIAAILPSRAVTIHTLFCLKESLPVQTQHVLCALLNSFVANYLIRLRVNTHVTASLMERLPVPLLDAEHPWFERLAVISRTLSRLETFEQPEYAELQAIVARLYGLTDEDFAHVLTTFPLISQAVRDASLRQFLETT